MSVKSRLQNLEHEMRNNGEVRVILSESLDDGRIKAHINGENIETTSEELHKKNKKIIICVLPKGGLDWIH